MNHNILTVQNVRFRYRTRTGFLKRFEHTALKDISFSIRQGETIGVLGRNGCGKSTLLKILAGLMEPTSGRVICDRNIKRALLTLGLGFRLDLSGRDNAILSTMLQGATKMQALQQLEEIHNFSELGDFFNQPVRTYSAGMRSRLGFSTAIKTDVDVLLIDEVLSVGDAGFRKKAEEVMLERINGRQTVVFVSHSAEQVQKLCRRSVWLENGLIKSIGNTEDILNLYRQDALKRKT